MAPAAQPLPSLPVGCHHAVDRGDLLRLLRLGIPPEEAGRLCGFVLIEQPEQPESHSPRPLTTRVPPSSEPKVTPAPPQAAPQLWRAIGPDLRQPDPAERQRPACLDRKGLEGKTGDELRAKNPAIVPPAPLASPARLGSMLRRMLTIPWPGSNVDAPKLVRLLASLRPIRRLPRKHHRSWPRRLQIYWDQTQALGPCLDDQRAVLTWLRRWRGEAGLECIVLSENGAARWYPNRRRGQGPREAQTPRPPDAGTTILALTDMGFADGEITRQARWSRLHSQAVRAGADCHALVLAPRPRWQHALAQAWRAQAWDRAPGTGDSAQALEDLFVLLSPAIRIESGLLRDVRRLVGADLGVELDAWRDSRVMWRAAALGMVLDPQQAHGLQGRFRELPRERRDDVVKLLERFHRQLSPNILEEERVAAGEDEPLVAIASQAKGLVDKNSHHDDLPKAVSSYLERLVGRLSPEAWSKHPELTALWAAAHRTRDGFATPFPDGIEPQQVLWALESVPQPTAWLLFQKGTELRLLPGAGLPVTSDLGSLLTQIQTRFPRLAARWHPAGGKARTAIVEAGRPFKLPLSAEPPEVRRVELVGDLGKAEIRLDSRPEWADRFWRDSDGLWVETTVRGFEWSTGKTESWMGRKATSLTIEPQDLPTRLLWPTWATHLSKDERGVSAELDLGDNVVTLLRWIPPGRFLMGSPKYEKGRDDDEGPQHWVALTQGFWLADAPCTQAEWRVVMGTEPSHHKGEGLAKEKRDKLPVEQVTWEDCQQFCEKLRARFPGLEAMLPSEAQWEYACRAGTASGFNDGSACTEPTGKDPALAKLGWFSENSAGGTRPVRERERNHWGLHDMHGNVWEWCQDQYGDYVPEDQEDPIRVAGRAGRVGRGGSWVNLAGICRSACRVGGQPDERNRLLGFRLASGQSGQVSQERADGKQAGRRPAAPVGERAKGPRGK